MTMKILLLLFTHCVFSCIKIWKVWLNVAVYIIINENSSFVNKNYKTIICLRPILLRNLHFASQILTGVKQWVFTARAERSDISKDTIHVILSN